MVLAATNPGAFGEALALLVVGMLVVFGALTLLMGFVFLLNRLAPVGNAPIPTSRPAPTSTASADTRLIAVLTAAAATALHSRVRITHVEPTESEPGR